jgi:hypothetical protein
VERKKLGKRSFEYPKSSSEEQQLEEFCAVASTDPALFLKKLAVAFVQAIVTDDVNAKEKARKFIGMLWVDGETGSFFVSSGHPIAGNEFKELVSDALGYFITTGEFPDVEKTWNIRHCCSKLVDFINRRGNIWGTLAEGYHMSIYQDGKERVLWYKECPFCGTKFRLPEGEIQFVEDLPPEVRKANETYDAHMAEWFRQQRLKETQPTKP